ncbi:MAG: YraN family protein [Nitrospirae bacterium]|nr:MAG: YraN family protein [Nitrospirota bacterium]
MPQKARPRSFWSAGDTGSSLTITAPEDRGTLVFIEVKARATDRFGGPGEAITPAKQARIARLAQQFLTARRLGDRPCRFDAVLISGEDPRSQRIELVTAAFEIAPPAGHRAAP